MKHQLLAFTFLVLCGYTVSGQNHFQNLYNTGGDDYSNQIIPNGTGGYVVIGSSSSGSGGYDCIMESFDSTGALLWTHLYGGSSTEYGTALALANNGIVATGRTKSFSSNSSQDVYLLKTGSNGDMQWVKGYHSDSIEYGYGVASVQNGGYYITGETKAYSAGNFDMFIIKTDTGGTPIWQKTFGGTGTETGTSIFEGDQHGFVVVGTTSSTGAGGNDALIIVGDSTGTPLVEAVLGGAGDEEGAGVVGGPNNTAFIAGTSGSLGQDKIFLASINTNTFTLNWAKVYGGSGVDQLSSIQQLPNGNMVLTGSTNSFGNQNGSSGLVFEVDTLGNVLWATIVGNTGNTFLNASMPLNDNTVVTTGNTNLFSFSANDYVYLSHFSTNGALCDSSEFVTLTVQNWTPTVTASPSLSGISSQTANFTTYAPAFIDNTVVATATTLCGALTAVTANAGSASVICSGSNVSIGGNPTGAGGAGPYTYSWSPVTGLSSDTAANPVAQPAGTTTYIVTVTDHLGSTATAQVTISIDTPAHVTFTLSTDTFCTNGGSVTLQATPGGGTFSGNGVSGSTFSPSTVSAGHDTLSYTYTDGAQCPSSARVAIDVEVCGAINNIESTTFSVVPNPSKGNFELDFADMSFAGALIHVYDVTGRIVYTDKVNDSPVMRLSLTTLPVGPYIIQINGSGQTVTRKLIID